MTPHPEALRRAAAELHAEGWTKKAIARELGVASHTVARWLDPDLDERTRQKNRARKQRHAGACRVCGRPTDGSNGRANAPELCRYCEPVERRVWTEAAIIDAIRLYAHRYGAPPTATHWNPPLARRAGRPEWADRFYRDGDYPAANTVQVRFGSWNAGLRAAGFEPRATGKHGPHYPRPDLP